MFGANLIIETVTLFYRRVYVVDWRHTAQELYWAGICDTVVDERRFFAKKLFLTAMVFVGA